MPSELDLWLVLVACVVLVGGCAIEARRDARAGVDRGTILKGWALVLIALLIIAGAMVGARYAHARDVDGRFAASPLKSWFDGLRSGRGPCCSDADADGYALSDVDWEAREGRYRVRIPRSNDPSEQAEMVWLEVPEDALITEPNRAGRTMVWPIWGYTGSSIRCFMPGSMT